MLVVAEVTVAPSESLSRGLKLARSGSKLSIECKMHIQYLTDLEKQSNGHDKIGGSTCSIARTKNVTNRGKGNGLCGLGEDSVRARVRRYAVGEPRHSPVTMSRLTGRSGLLDCVRWSCLWCGASSDTTTRCRSVADNGQRPLVVTTVTQPGHRPAI